MLEMTEILGNVGNFIGAIGVVGSLVYLAIRVRHSRESTNANARVLDDAHRLALAQTYQARSAALLETSLFVAGSADVAEIFTRFSDAASGGGRCVRAALGSGAFPLPELPQRAPDPARQSRLSVSTRHVD